MMNRIIAKLVKIGILQINPLRIAIKGGTMTSIAGDRGNKKIMYVHSNEKVNLRSPTSKIGKTRHY